MQCLVWCYVDARAGDPRALCPDAVLSQTKQGAFWSRYACITWSQFNFWSIKCFKTFVLMNYQAGLNWLNLDQEVNGCPACNCKRFKPWCVGLKSTFMAFYICMKKPSYQNARRVFSTFVMRPSMSLSPVMMAVVATRYSVGASSCCDKNLRANENWETKRG